MTLLVRSQNFYISINRCPSRRMARHIRDLNVESARDFKFNQVGRWSNNKENDQKMADNAYLFLAFVCSETRRTIERNSFEIPARVKTDPILKNYLTQTMENNARSGVRRL